MAPQAVFFQACPVCGRSLRMPVQCFGRAVTCVHCGGEFQASEQSGAALPSLGRSSLPAVLPQEVAPRGGCPLPQLLLASEVPSPLR
jgi:hypothetical protein